MNIEYLIRFVDSGLIIAPVICGKPEGTSASQPDLPSVQLGGSFFETQARMAAQAGAGGNAPGNGPVSPPGGNAPGNGPVSPPGGNAPGNGPVSPPGGNAPGNSPSGPPGGGVNPRARGGV